WGAASIGDFGRSPRRQNLPVQKAWAVERPPPHRHREGAAAVLITLDSDNGCERDSQLSRDRAEGGLAARAELCRACREMEEGSGQGHGDVGTAHFGCHVTAPAAGPEAAWSSCATTAMSGNSRDT